MPGDPLSTMKLFVSSFLFLVLAFLAMTSAYLGVAYFYCECWIPMGAATLLAVIFGKMAVAEFVRIHVLISGH